MHRTARHLLPALGLLLLGTAAEAQYTVYGISGGAGGQQLVRFSTDAPGTVTTLGPTGAPLIGIDFRPATGVLYGYDGNLLYTLSTATGGATQAYDVGNTTGAVGFDFNPAADRIRVVDGSGVNLRLNPNDGATIVDGGFTYGAGDPFAGLVPALTGAAYINNDNDINTPTTLYGIDGARGTLVLLSAPNGGAATTVGSLGLAGSTVINGFDIVTVGGMNTAFLTVFDAGASLSRLYTLNLANGATTLVGNVGIAGGVQGIAIVPGVAVVPEPATVVLLGSGLAICGLVARRRRTRA